jgi:hypothetical protein
VGRHADGADVGVRIPLELSQNVAADIDIAGLQRGGVQVSLLPSLA